MPDNRLVDIAHFLSGFADGVHDPAVHTVVSGNAHSGAQCNSKINPIEAAPAPGFPARGTVREAAERAVRTASDGCQ